MFKWLYLLTDLNKMTKLIHSDKGDKLTKIKLQIKIEVKGVFIFIFRVNSKVHP